MIRVDEDRQQKLKTEIGSPARETERLKVKVGIGSEETSECCVKQLRCERLDSKLFRFYMRRGGLVGLPQLLPLTFRFGFGFMPVQYME